MNPSLFRLDHTLKHDPSIEAWFAIRLAAHPPELSTLAHHWFQIMRQCGDEVRELLHDGHPHACLGEYPFAYVNVFTAHVNIGFFQGASLQDPAHLCQGTGKSMRHVKLKPEAPINAAALNTLIRYAYSEIKARMEHG